LQLLSYFSNDPLTVSSQLWFAVLNQKTPPNHLSNSKKSQSPSVLLRSFPACFVSLRTSNIKNLHSLQTGSYSSTIYSSILKPTCSSPSSSRTLSMSSISLPQQNLKNMREELRGQEARYTNC